MKKPEKKTDAASGRVLYHIPIIHTQADMGGLSESIRRSAIRELGQGVWRRKQHTVDQMWTRIEQFLSGLRLPAGKVRLYQDGLPVCDREEEIIRDLASRGSRNYRLLLRLREKGATIMGTESPQLLVEEYRLARQVLAGEAHSGGIDHQELLRKRDSFIAGRINATLREGETGILLLGMLHSMEDLLDGDIRVIAMPPLNDTR